MREPINVRFLVFPSGVDVVRTTHLLVATSSRASVLAAHGSMFALV